MLDPWEARRGEQGAGTVISGWQFTNRFTLRSWSVPDGLDTPLVRRFGRPPTVEEVFGRPSLSWLKRLRRELVAAPARLADAATELIRKEPYDLVWIGLPAVHMAGHQLMDPGSQLWDAASGARDVSREDRHELETGLADVYTAADTALGRLLEAMPADTDVIVLSSVGMDVNTGRSDLLPGMLRSVLRGHAARERQDGGGTWIWRLRAQLPTDFRTRVARSLPEGLLYDVTASARDAGHRLVRDAGIHTAHRPVRLRAAQHERPGARGNRRAWRRRRAHGRDRRWAPDVPRPGRWAGGRSSRTCRGRPRRRRRPSPHARPRRALGGSSRHAVGGSRVAEVRRRRAARRWERTVRQSSGRCVGADRPRDVSRRRESTAPPSLVDFAPTACSLLGVDRDGLVGEPLLEPR